MLVGTLRDLLAAKARLRDVVTEPWLHRVDGSFETSRHMTSVEKQGRLLSVADAPESFHWMHKVTQEPSQS